MHDALSNLQEILDEDVLLRQPLSGFNMRHLAEKTGWVDGWTEAGAGEEAWQLCRGHLERHPTSVYALFFMTLLGARGFGEWLPHMERLFSLFTQQKKMSLVVYVAQEVLKVHDSASALWTLAQIHQHDHNHEELLDVWERLLRLEPSDHQLPLKIGALKEKLGHKGEAARYIRMSLLRALEKKEGVDAFDAWKKLLQVTPDDHEFTLQVGRRLVGLLSKERQRGFWRPLLEPLRRAGEAQVDQTIAVLKEALKIEPEVGEYRDHLIAAWRLKYKNHSQLENYLGLSGLLRPWKNPSAQMDLFERPIRFDKGSYVVHKSFGYGAIVEIHHGTGRGEEALNTTRLVIDFESKKGHGMTMRIALTSLTLLPENDLIAQKKFAPELFQSRLAGSREELALATLQALGKPSSAAEIKAVFVPPMEDKAYAELWKEMKKILEGGGTYEVRNKLYTLVPGGMSTREDLLAQYRSARDLDVKLSIAELILGPAKSAEGLEDFIADLQAKMSPPGPSSLKVAWTLLTAEKQGVKGALTAVAEGLKKILASPVLPEALDQVKLPLQRISLLEHFGRHFLEDLVARSADLLLTASPAGKGKLLEILAHKDKVDVLKALWQKAEGARHEWPEAYVVAARFFVVHPSSRKAGLDVAAILKKLLELLAYAQPHLGQAPGSGVWRRVSGAIQTLLFTEGHLAANLSGSMAPEKKKDLFDTVATSHFLEDYIRVEFRELSTKSS